MACLLTMISTPLGWDERVYVSQVARHIPPLVFTAPRARGVTWLVAPVAALTTSTPALRCYLAVLAGLGLIVAWWPWLRLRPGATVPLAAAVYGLLWTSLFYGPSVMPNSWLALAAVAAVGQFLAAVSPRQPRRALPALAVAIVAAAMIRPTDSLWLSAPLIAAALAVPAWRRWRVVAVLAGAVVVGWLPWLVEAQQRYGGVRHRLATGSALQGGVHPQWSVLVALRAINGPTLCRPCAGRPVPLTGLLVWVGGALAVGVAVLLAARRQRLSRTVVPVAVAASLAVPYLFLIDYSAPRFLLPSYALLTLPVADAAVGLYPMVRRTGLRRLVPAGYALILLGFGAAEARVLARVVDDATVTGASWATAATALTSHGVRPPCVLYGPSAAPIAYQARCSAGRRALVTAAGARGAVVLRKAEQAPAWVRGWPVTSVSTSRGTYLIYRRTA